MEILSHRFKSLAFNLGFCMMVAGCVLFYIIFLTAYLSPNMEFLIGVNWFGEANCEFLVFSLLAPCVIYFIKRVLIEVDKS